MKAPLRFSTVTCITDLGLRDESVGLIHSILRDHCESLTVIDLCHYIDPGDTKAAALMLARSVPHLATGVVLASVGRRLERPAIAVEVGDGQAVLVGPDNGVLAAAVALVGGTDLAVRISGEDSVAVTPSEASSDDAAPIAAIHPARDVLAPAVARICKGEPLESIGEPIDSALLLPSVLSMPRTEDDGTLVAEVLSLDNSGVAQLNIDRSVLAELITPGESLKVSFGEDTRLATLSQPALSQPTLSQPTLSQPTQASAAPGRLILAEDVHAMLEVLVGGNETAADIGLAVGTEVRLQKVKEVVNEIAISEVTINEAKGEAK